MKFFIPCAESRAESEEIWGQLRARLFDLGLPTTRRRIQALALGSDGDWILLEVGMETPDEETVLAVFEASNIDLFYVCTPQQMLEQACPSRSASPRARRWSISTRGWWGMLESGGSPDAPSSSARVAPWCTTCGR